MKSRTLLVLLSVASLSLCSSAFARGIRLDLGFEGSPWSGPTTLASGALSLASGPLGSGPLSADPAGVSSSTALLEWTAGSSPALYDTAGGTDQPTFIYSDDSNNFCFTCSSPSESNSPPHLQPGTELTFDSGYMFNWGPSGNPTAQLLVLAKTEGSPSVFQSAGDVLCDDNSAAAAVNDFNNSIDGTFSANGYSGCGWVTSGTKIWEVQINFQDACGPSQLGSTLSFAGLSYKNTSQGNAGSCDNTFVFTQTPGGSVQLYGTVPDGWTPVPLPETWLLLTSGVACLLLLRRPGRRRPSIRAAHLGA